MGQTDVEADAAAARIRRPSIRRFHDAASAAGAIGVTMRGRWQAHRPFSDEAGERSCVLIITPQGSFLTEAGGSEKDDRVLDLLAAERFQRFQILGKNSQRPGRTGFARRVALGPEGPLS